MVFSPYAEQKPVFVILQRVLQAGKIHHAFLFAGPCGTGKSTFARQWAKALNCERQTFPPCDGCAACVKIENGTHPDVISVDLTAKGLTERIRDLVGHLGYSPHEGKFRVILIDPADELSGAQGRGEAANALLKALEEPPRHTLFILSTSAPRLLPITIRSRCILVPFAPISQAEIARWLVEEKSLTPEAAHKAALRGQGGLVAPVGTALVDDQTLVTAADHAAKLIALARAQRLSPALSRLPPVLGEIADSREYADEVLVASLLLIREALRDRQGMDRDESGSPLLQTAPLSVTELLRAFGNLVATRTQLRGNVAPLLLVESLLFHMFGEFPDKPSYTLAR